MIDLLKRQGTPNAFSARCPSREVLALIGEKWVSLVIAALNRKTMRFGELKRTCEGISQKMLTQTLRKLERDGLVVRTVYADELPLKVEYSLSDLGKSLVPVVLSAKAWAETNLRRVETSRLRYSRDKVKANREPA